MPGHGEQAGIDGWTTFSVLALMAASAAGAGLAVGWKSEGRKNREREYSNAGKFVSPAYASLSDMESVSCWFLRMSYESYKPISEKLGVCSDSLPKTTPFFGVSILNTY